MKLQTRNAAVFLFLGICTLSAMAEFKGYNDETLIFVIPDQYEYKTQKKTENKLLLYVGKKSESLDNWTELIVATYLYGNLALSPSQYFDASLQDLKRICDDLEGNIIRSGEIHGYDYSIWATDCNTTKNIVNRGYTFWKAIKGNDRFYVITHSWRKQPDIGVLKKSADNLSKIYVCDSRIPDRKCPASK